MTLENITYSIAGKKLVDDVSAKFRVGKLNLIVGPNGAGKSTVIKILSGQLKPTSGKAYLGLEEVFSIDPKRLSQIRAVLSQQIELAFPLKVWEVVMMGRFPHFVTKPSEQDERACEEAMRFFDVWNMADRNYLTLSGGEKQRVQFARVLTQIWFPLEGRPRYLLLDEPLTFLDIHYQFQFMKQLQKLIQEQNLVVVGVVHDLNLAARFADTVLLLNNGKVLASGTTREVFTKENIRTAFHLETQLLPTKNELGFYLYFE